MENIKISTFTALVSCIVISGAAAQGISLPEKPGWEPLPLNQIKVKGWMRNQMERDITSGYISVYDKLQPTMQGDVFGPVKKKNYSIDKDGNWETRRETWWPGEHEGYFADIVVRNGFLTSNRPWIDRAKKILDYVVANQGPEGYIGIYDEECRLDNLLNENGELWTQSRMLGAMLAYYEYTGDEKYFIAARKAVDYTVSRYKSSGKSYFHQPSPNGGGLTHGLMFGEILEWLYRLTKDTKYLDFAIWLYKDYSTAMPKIGNVDNQLGNLLDREKMFREHSVHVVEHFRIPFWLASATGNPEFRDAAINIFYKMRRSQGPTGTVVMDPKIHESVAGNYGSPWLPYEYCTITEGVISLTSAFQKFDYPTLGDDIENLAFNAGQGARLPDGKAISYSTIDNRKTALQENGFRNQLAACHRTACCNLQAAKLMPYYAAGMWMKRPDGQSIALALYGESEVVTKLAGTLVRISEKTMYPFGNTVELTVEPEKSQIFEICLRNPGWSANTEVEAPGASVTRDNGWIILSRKWKKGDRIRIVFDDPVKVERFMNNESFLRKGALIYAMKVDEKMTATKKFKEGFANYDTTPRDQAQAETIFNEYLFPSNPEVLIRRMPSAYRYEANPRANPDFPFDTPFGYIKGRFIVNGEDTEATLMPLGSSVLRKVTFKENK